MPQTDTYLFFNGNAADALRFYAHTLGGTVESLMKYSEAPPSDNPEPAGSPDSVQPTGADRDRLMHGSLRMADGARLMASDLPAAQPFEGMKGFAISLNYPTAEEARRIYSALSEGGQQTMPIGKTFWADAFGMVTDRFGTPWMVGGGAEPQ